MAWEERKSNKSFFRLESKKYSLKKNIQKLQKSDGTITIAPTEILKNRNYILHRIIQLKIGHRERDDVRACLDCTNTPTLTKEEQKERKGTITLEECHKVLTTFQNNKSPGNDGIQLNFIKRFGRSLEVLWLILLTHQSNKRNIPITKASSNQLIRQKQGQNSS